MSLIALLSLAALLLPAAAAAPPPTEARRHLLSLQDEAVDLLNAAAAPGADAAAIADKLKAAQRVVDTILRDGAAPGPDGKPLVPAAVATRLQALRDDLGRWAAAPRDASPGSHRA